MKNKDKTKNMLIIRLAPKEQNKLDKICKDEDRSKTYIITKIIEDYLNDKRSFTDSWNEAQRQNKLNNQNQNKNENEN